MPPKQGKHPVNALTAVGVKKATKPGRHADGNGLYLVVDPSGAKRWVLRVVVKGKRRDIGLGGTSTVSLADARGEAMRLRGMARKGGDPLAERRKEKKVIPTFQEAAETVHRAHEKSWKNVKHRDQWINTLRDYVYPHFGTKLISEIDTADVMGALSPIWLAKPETARRVRQRIKAVLDWAKAAQHRSGDNPATEIHKVLPKQPPQREHHAALPYSRVPGFIKKLHESDCSESGKLAFEFMILTATRTNEVLQATWREVDLQGKTWIIPAPRMKAQKEHRVPLSPRCIDILKQAGQLSEGDYVFPGRRSGHLSNMVFLMTLRRMAMDVTAHGFRSSFRDWASERTNYPREVCEAALAHTVQDKVEAAYKRTDLFDRRRQLMTTWAAFVTSTKGNVVPMRTTKG